MSLRSILPVLFGLLLTIAVALFAARQSDAVIAQSLTEQATEAIAGVGDNHVSARFYTVAGSPTRHPLLSGGENLDESTRDRVAKAIGAIPGVGSVQWEDGTMRAQSAQAGGTPANCEKDVDALLRARTIRFEESSADIDRASYDLVDEVAKALRPCLGSIIAITGHTDNSGPEPGNIALSQQRAESVRIALIDRGIPSDGLRVGGLGSSQPVEGLAPGDPANRRIEFSVVATVPLIPTPVDTPAPR
ncbi:MAG: OmpA family protein [Sphingomonadaceae bacterium]